MSIDTENNLGDVEAERLGEQICELAGHQAAAMCRWLLLIADFDDRQGWAVDGIISCAHWLSWRCGIVLGTARDHVTVARRLVHLPLTIARFGTGELSYAKVRALVRVATPDNEASLVDLALEATASQFEQMVREFKRSEREALGNAAKRRARRYLRHRYHPDGSMIITIRVEPEDGALVIDYVEGLARADAKANEPDTVIPAADSSAEEPTPDPDENDIESSPGEKARADALVNLARRAADALQERVDDEAFIVGDRPHLLIHLNIDAVGRPDGSHLDHGPAVPFATACRLGCEGTVAILVEGQDGNPLHLGDTHHGINRAQRRALLARDKGCRFPGCTNRRYLHAHHIKHWIDGGPTCIADLVLLCSRHHHAVHEGRFGCSGANGKVTLIRPHTNITIAAAPTTTPADPADSVEVQNRQLGLTISDTTPGSISNGARYDRGLTSDVLWTLVHPKAFCEDIRQERTRRAA